MPNYFFKKNTSTPLSDIDLPVNCSKVSNCREQKFLWEAEIFPVGSEFFPDVLKLEASWLFSKHLATRTCGEVG